MPCSYITAHLWRSITIIGHLVVFLFCCAYVGLKWEVEVGFSVAVVDFPAVVVKVDHSVKVYVLQGGTCRGCQSLKSTSTTRVRQWQTDLWFVVLVSYWMLVWFCSAAMQINLNEFMENVLWPVAWCVAHEWINNS